MIYSGLIMLLTNITLGSSLPFFLFTNYSDNFAQKCIIKMFLKIHALLSLYYFILINSMAYFLFKGDIIKVKSYYKVKYHILSCILLIQNFTLCILMQVTSITLLFKVNLLHDCLYLKHFLQFFLCFQMNFSCGYLKP